MTCPDCGKPLSKPTYRHCARCAAIRRGRAERMRRMKPYMHQLQMVAEMIQRYVADPDLGWKTHALSPERVTRLTHIDARLARLVREVGALAEDHMVALNEQRRPGAIPETEVA